MKNELESSFFARLIVSERKQLALMADEELHVQLSHRLLRDKSLRNGE